MGVGTRLTFCGLRNTFDFGPTVNQELATAITSVNRSCDGTEAVMFSVDTVTMVIKSVLEVYIAAVGF